MAWRHFNMADITIKVIDRENNTHSLLAPTDMNMNLMELLKANKLPVEGTCGGMALCASCHCYRESEHELKPQSDAELDMLDQTFAVIEEKSRLACQIYLQDDLDGLIVRLAPI